MKSKQSKTISNKVPFTIASFDVGIKNLAFCVMQYNDENPVGKQFPIQQWKNIDLTDNECITDKVCCAKLKTKKDKDGNPVRQAKLCVDKMFYCATHNPDKTKYKIKKSPKAYNIPLKTSCITLAKRLDEFEELWKTKVDHIIIEKQYTKNRKMITQSDLVFSYFILKHVMNDMSRIKDVRFIHAKNKLNVYTGPKVTIKLKNPKDRRKKMAIEYCKYMLKNDKKNLNYLTKFPKKTDDLSDSFLQGAWYLKHGRHPKFGTLVKTI
jgi:hypothetical protein